MLKLTNIKLALVDKWDDLGRINQVLITFSGITLLTLSISSYFFVKQAYDVRNLKCLAMNIYHEARSEPESGQYAVAVVTMNRVKSNRYPNDVCKVVYQKAWSKKYQRYISAFSWTTDGKDNIPYESSAWKQVFKVASEVYHEDSSSKVKGALFYHADYVKPRWAKNKIRITKIGRHIFYK